MGVNEGSEVVFLKRVDSYNAEALQRQLEGVGKVRFKLSCFHFDSVLSANGLEILHCVILLKVLNPSVHLMASFSTRPSNTPDRLCSILFVLQLRSPCFFVLVESRGDCPSIWFWNLSAGTTFASQGPPAIVRVITCCPYRVVAGSCPQYIPILRWFSSSHRGRVDNAWAAACILYRCV